MAEGDDGQEKTEDPTPRRKEQAREDGKVVTSKEVFVLFSIISAMAIISAAGSMGETLAGSWASWLRWDSSEQLDSIIIQRLKEALWALFLIGMGIGIPMLALTIGVQAAMGGLNWAPKAMAFKPDKMDPLKGLKRMVSMKSLVELGKALMKVGLLGGAAYGVLLSQIPEMELMYTMAPGPAAAMFQSGVIRLLSALIVGLLVIGVVDYGYQFYSLNKSLKMSRQELKDEAKQTEGSPELKGAIRRRQMEASQGAKRAKALDDVPNATAVITNPTHFAIALRYAPEEADAPIILAMGRGAMAHRIMERASKARVTTVQAPPLARALYYTGQIGEMIPEALFVAVAAILAHVYRLDHDMPTDMPDLDIPKELRLDEHGRPEKEA
ncbi:EscU/YscU/HrcU family type III secretion system export apparatus switch protein [Donghicola sp. C2-DW-16]|uniref:EscU/YscU/HrcU family type III secretion system export apparatus switch protein n=1 Tax=Donghicola mangrovi TaxID=2729614 RepID=A0A850PZ66_9RHOB|nr:EscU/YscU/HrcU family type III secretion system export apparatus switch protein [Donghicola mangrovi]NVO22083.1 EscU/YscU/HrcU family type III secretion system export apparatus switch protein [Donghicola mangrovi]NVO26326.1 EscU/YscU/HrcU family type III secretion system export apparatus switch protein [Donghicola mangrovi]